MQALMGHVCYNQDANCEYILMQTPSERLEPVIALKELTCYCKAGLLDIRADVYLHNMHDRGPTVGPGTLTFVSVQYMEAAVFQGYLREGRLVRAAEYPLVNVTEYARQPEYPQVYYFCSMLMLAASAL